MASLLSLIRVADATKCAVLFDDGDSLCEQSYQDLEHFSDAVAQLLNTLECGKEVVAIAIGHPLHQTSLILGVLKATAAFFSVDVDGPVEFLSHVIRKLCVRVVLCTDQACKELSRKLALFKPSVIDTQYANFRAIRLQGLHSCKTEHPLAYVITTSGTTGVPKIVKVPHACIVPNVEYFRDKFAVTSNDVIFQASPLTFDPSIVNIFLALSAGATLLVVPDVVKLQPSKLVDILAKRHKTTIIQATPALISSVPLCRLQGDLLGNQSSVRVLALGGEKCPRTEQLRQWRGQGCCTQFYNVYGITEVSSWATCHRISASELLTDQDVPLGEAIYQTELVIKDGNNSVSDTGTLYIGSKDRVCLIDEEASLPRGTLRCTGDLVHTDKQGNVYYDGRTDEQCKRHGKRVNLVQLQKVAMRLSEVTNAVALLSDNRLLLFLHVPRVDLSLEGKARGLIRDSLPRHYVPDNVVLLDVFPMTSHGKTDKKALLEMGERESRTVDMRQSSTVDILKDLLKLLVGTDCSKTIAELGADSFTRITFISRAEAVFKVSIPAELVESLLTGRLETTLNSIADFIDLKISESCKKRKIDEPEDEEVTEDNVGAGDGAVLGQGHVDPEVAGSQDNGSNEIGQTAGDSDLLEIKQETWTYCFSSVQRTGVCYNNFCPAVARCCDQPSDHSKQPERSPYAVRCYQKFTDDARSSRTKISLELKFKYDMDKCIDASPLLVSAQCGDRLYDIVVIGSHAHRLAAVDSQSGIALWDIRVADRVESSACLSACGKYVVVGCYDGMCYVVELLKGNIFWCHETGGQVKSSPCLEPSTGLVIVGSHDQHLHALDIQRKKCAWRCHVGGGSIFSSPCIGVRPGTVVVATLSGTVATVDSVTGELVWNVKLDKPVFSSPAVTESSIAVCCVDATCYTFDASGNLIWSYSTSQAIFSSPCVWPKTPVTVCQGLTSYGDQCSSTRGAISSGSFPHVQKRNENTSVRQPCVLFGSHDKVLYCISSDGKCMWKFETESAVYSSPFVFNRKCQEGVKNCEFDELHAHQREKRGMEFNQGDISLWCTHAGGVHYGDGIAVVCCTAGTLYAVSLNDGFILASYRFPGEVFSSPVVFKNRIYIGCRDNYLYCLSINES